MVCTKLAHTKLQLLLWCFHGNRCSQHVLHREEQTATCLNQDFPVPASWHRYLFLQHRLRCSGFVLSFEWWATSVSVQQKDVSAATHLWYNSTGDSCVTRTASRTIRKYVLPLIPKNDACVMHVLPGECMPCIHPMLIPHLLSTNTYYQHTYSHACPRLRPQTRLACRHACVIRWMR